MFKIHNKEGAALAVEILTEKSTEFRKFSCGIVFEDDSAFDGIRQSGYHYQAIGYGSGPNPSYRLINIVDTTGFPNGRITIRKK